MHSGSPSCAVRRRLGQRGRRRGHDGSGGRIGERLEHDPRAAGGGLVAGVRDASGVAHSRHQSTVSLEQLVERSGDRVPAAARRRRARGRSRSAQAARGLPARPSNRPTSSCSGSSVSSCSHHTSSASLPPIALCEPVPVTADPRPDLAVVEPRRDPHLELDRAAHALDHAEDLALVGADRGRRGRESSRAVSPRPLDRRSWSRARACRRGRTACTPTAHRRSARSSSGRRARGRAGGRTRSRSRIAAGSTNRSTRLAETSAAL